MNLLKKAASGEGAYFERYLRLEAKYERQNKASEQLVKKHKTLQKKVDKLELVAQVLSTVDALQTEDSGVAIAFQKHLFSDDELDLMTAVKFVDEVKKHLALSQKHAEVLIDD